MMKFISQYEKDAPIITVDIKHSDITLDELLPLIQGFLQAAGFVIDGELEISEKEN